MNLSRFVNMIPSSKRQIASNKLVDSILTSKNDEKMPNALANTILHYWQQNLLESEHGLTVLLEASVLLEPEKTVTALNELQLTDIAEGIRAEMKS